MHDDADDLDDEDDDYHASRLTGGRVSRKDLEASLQEVADSDLVPLEVKDLVVKMDAFYKAQLEQAQYESKPVHSDLMHEAPTNWHQMCVFFLASTDEQDEIFKHHGGGMLAVSFLLVLFQVATVCGVMTGTILPTCTTTYQCKMAQEEGLFCRIKSDGSDNRCMFCGDAATLRMQLPGSTTLNSTTVRTVCNNPFVLVNDREPMPGHTPTAILEWCDGCVNPSTYEVETQSQVMMMVSNVAGMGTFDTFTLVFATTVIALHVVSELKGIELVDIAIRQAERSFEMGGPMNIGTYGRPLKFINVVRRWVFLPTQVAAIPILIGFRGGDALNICMNTVAMLFLMEIDDVLFHYGVGERVRRRAMVAGRVELSRTEEASIERTKSSHVILLCASVLYAVRTLNDGYVWAVFLQFGAFWLGAVLEAGHYDGNTIQKIGQMVAATAKCWGGFLVFGYIIQLSGHTFN